MVANALCCHAEDEQAIKELGIAKSKPLTGAFFFWNYQYVEAPYVVERRGLDIFINDILVDRGPGWRPLDYAVKDPGDPPPNWDLWRDDTNYGGNKWGYLAEKYEIEEARRRMVEVYRKGLAGGNLRWEPGSRYVRVTSKDGEKMTFGLITEWKEQSHSKEQLLEQARKAVQGYEHTLQCRGNLLWMGTSTPIVSTGAMGILDIMLSDSSAPEKLRRLEEQHLVLMPEIRKLVTECPKNEQLIKRFAMLKKGELEEPSADTSPRDNPQPPK